MSTDAVCFLYTPLQDGEKEEHFDVCVVVSCKSQALYCVCF